MKKKIAIFCASFLIALCPAFLVGCNQSSDIEDNMSEITKIYYQGGDANNDVRASISVGQREKDPYIIDGYQNGTCDFSLIAVNFNKQLEEETIETSLTINGDVQNFTMYLNPVNHFYMADLGYALGENDTISLAYQEFNIDFYNISKDFTVVWEQALIIAEDSLGEKLSSFYQGKNFEGECYLKILTEQNDSFDDLFWYFSAVSREGETINVVISVDSGEVLAG